MTLSIPKGELILSEDIVFNINIALPFFGENSGYSLPFTLPANEHNLSLLGFPNRINKYYKPELSFPANFQCGSVSIFGTLVIDSFDSKEGIICYLTAESDNLFAEFQEKQLKDIFSGLSKQLTKMDGGYDNIAEFLFSLYCQEQPLEVGTINSEFSVFPLKAHIDEKYSVYLNDPVKDIRGEEIGFQYHTRTYVSDEGEYKVPEFYGITPFLKLWALIEYTFTLSGFSIIENDFREAPFSNLTVVSNCADGLCDSEGQIAYYSDMVPAITVGELISWLQDKFAACIIFQRGAISIKFLANIIKATPDMDLTDYCQTGKKITFPESCRVILDVDKSLEGSEPAAETLIDHTSSAAVYKNVARVNYNEQEAGYHYDITTGRFYKTIDGILTNIGSNVFRYDRKNSVDTEEHNASDRFLPMTMNSSGHVLPFIGRVSHYRTNISGAVEANEQPIMLCWDLWNPYTSHRFGTTQKYTEYGQKVAPFDLTPEGIYEPFWEAYNELLLNQMPELKVTLNLNTSDRHLIDVTRPKLLDGNPVIIKSISYSMSENKNTLAEAVLLPIIRYSDAIKDIKPVSRVTLKWEYVSTHIKALQAYTSLTEGTVEEIVQSISYIDGNEVLIRELDGVTSYTEANTPKMSPLYLGQETLSRTRSVKFECFNRKRPAILATYYFSFREYFVAVVKE